MATLSAGAVVEMMEALKDSSSFNPIMQIAGIKKMVKEGGPPRYRLLLNDGVHTTSSAMLSSSLNNLIDSDQLATYCVVKVKEFTVNGREANSKRIVMINDVDIIKSGPEVAGKLGTPTAYKHGESVQTTSHGGAGEAPKVNEAAQENKPPTSGGFYGQKPQSEAAKNMNASTPAMRKTGAEPTTPGGSVVKVYPIASITPYQNRWTIKARVTQKSGVRTYSNSRGEGKFFNCIFTDDSGEIKSTAWKGECDRYFDMLELNKVYFISKGLLKTANKQFSNTNNDYEMNLTGETKIQVCDEDEAASVPALQYSFVNIGALSECTVGNTVDVCGIVNNIGETATIIARSSQREMTKRDLELVDDSLMSVRLTIWGDEAKNFQDSGTPILAIKGAKISDWNGRSLSSLSSSQVMLNPDCADAHRLRGWYDTNGANASFKSHQSDGAASSGSSGSKGWKTLSCVQSENLGMGEKPDYYTVKALPMYIKKDNCMYMACASEGCNKKVIDNNDGTYRCEKCNKSSQEFKYRLILQCNLGDATSSIWATAFQDTAEKMLGKTAADMGNLRENNEDLFEHTIKCALYKPYQMTLRSKMESYNDDKRLKTVCVEVKDLDIIDYNKRLVADLKKMMSEQ